LSFDGLRGSFPGGGLPLAGAVTGPVRLDGTLAALATHADLQSTQDGGGVQVDGVLTLLASRLGARDATVRTRELDLSRWLAAPAAPSSRLSGTLAGSVGADSGAAPAGAVTAALRPSLFAGAGAARVAVTLEGALDSLAVEARASLERLRWREWEVPAGRARVTYRPGPVPAIAGEVALDSLALGERGFGAATASVAGTRDSLAWFARSRVGQVGAVLAGGRYVRRADAASVAVDSLALQLQADVRVLRRPAAFVTTDSGARAAGP